MSTEMAIKREQAPALQRQSEPVTPAQMLQIAVEQNADLDKLQQLMDLQDRWEANQARKAFVEAMSGFRGACPAIDRDRDGHNSKYASLAGTIEQIKALLSEYQLSHSWRTHQDGQMITVTCTVTHAMGHSESTSLTAAPDGSGNKNSIQAIGSAVSYLERYTLFAILGLASKEMDNDGAGVAPARQQAPAKKTLTDARLANAIEAIKAGTYTLEQMADFDLTVAQRTRLNSELEVAK